MRTGIWLVGSRGSVAVTSIVGASAVRAGLVEPLGCVAESPPLRSPAVPQVADLVFGGHDRSTVRLAKAAESLAAAGVIPGGLVAALAGELAAVEEEIRLAPHQPLQAEAAAQAAAQITEFRQRQGLDRVVVVNVSTTEPAATPHPAHADLGSLEAALRGDGAVLPQSSLYAYAAFRAGCSYVDFTPSTGARLPALAQLATQAACPYAGHDGKTGETLVKSVLAPMFAMRHLRVHSWSGTNLLGGDDGANLAVPAANVAKTTSKHRVLRETLGYQPEGQTRIDYLPELGDFKTAWDLIVFSGFLGTRMRLEFTWQGCDSALAAPLVLDLARLTAAAHAAGKVGPLPALAFFFKDPLGEVTHSLAAQWADLCEFVAELTPGSADATVA